MRPPQEISLTPWEPIDGEPLYEQPAEEKTEGNFRKTKAMPAGIIQGPKDGKFTEVRGRKKADPWRIGRAHV